MLTSHLRAESQMRTAYMIVGMEGHVIGYPRVECCGPLKLVYFFGPVWNWSITKIWYWSDPSKFYQGFCHKKWYFNWSLVDLDKLLSRKIMVWSQDQIVITKVSCNNKIDGSHMVINLPSGCFQFCWSWFAVVVWALSIYSKVLKQKEAFSTQEPEFESQKKTSFKYFASGLNRMGAALVLNNKKLNFLLENKSENLCQNEGSCQYNRAMELCWGMGATMIDRGFVNAPHPSRKARTD